MVYTIERSLHQTGSLSTLEQTALTQVIIKSKALHANRGDIIFTQGAQADSAYFVTEGIIVLRRYLQNGKLVVPHVAHRDEWIGLAPALHPDFGLYLNEAQALMPSELYRFKVSAIEQLASEIPEFGNIIRQDLARAVISLYENSEHLVRSPHGRLVKFLVDYGNATTYSEEDVQDVALDLKQDTIGEILGIQRETVNKILKELRGLDLVRKSGRGRIGFTYNLPDMIKYMMERDRAA